MSEATLEFSRPICVTDMGKAGLEFQTQATAEECAALAARLGLRAIGSLKADIRIKRWRKGGAHLLASVTGVMVRRCVVSLEEFDAPFDEVVDVHYAAPDDKIGTTAADDGELILDPESDEPPEPLEGDGFDAGEAIAQHLVVMLDPYPRKPDVEFEETGQKPEKVSPFSVLSSLKPDQKAPPGKT